MTLRTLKDLNLAGRRVFVRVDFNLPIKDGKILDDSRVKAALPTLNYILEKGGRPILASHLGRPKGPDPSQSLKPVAERLRQLSGRTVIFSNQPCGPEAEALSKALKPGEILLLENTRFEKGEKDDTPEAARKFRALADVYVNDAFGTAHRADASTHALALLFDERAAGLLMEREVAALTATVTAPEHPSSPSSAAPRSAASSRCSRPSSPRPTPSSSGAGWPTPSSRRRGWRSANP